MPNPARDTVAGRIYNDLRNLARLSGRGTDELMLGYVLERFLYRVSISRDGGAHFVLKGGLLLANLGARRMTRDIDLLGRGFPGDEGEITARIARIAATDVDDGVLFDAGELRTVPIREAEEYHGLRLTMPAGIARARLKLQLDISVGDPVTPGPRIIAYPQHLSDATFPLHGYPLETVIAEKLTTAIALGDVNTRDRDYADLYRIVTLHTVDRTAVAAAVTVTAAYRGIELRPLSAAITDLPTRRQSSYTAWRRRQGPAAVLYPETFAELVATVVEFADPLTTGDAPGTIWRPDQRRWA